MIFYIFYKYMHCFLDTQEVNRRKEISVYLLLVLWFTFVESFSTSDFSNIIMALIIFILTWLYQARLKKKLMVTVFAYGTYILCRTFVTYTLTFFYYDSEIAFLVEQIAMLASMYILELLTEIVAEHMKNIRIKMAENEHTKRQLAGYSNQLDVLKNSEEKVRGLRHDLKHHLNELMLLAERDESSEIKEYLKSMDSFMTYSREYVSSGNTDIDSLLNLMLDDAKRELGEVSCKVCIPSGLEIEPFDLNVILGNLLDKAIRAAKQTKEKYLRVIISYKMGMLLIHVENSYAGELIKKGGRYLSTKEDSTAHGMGLANVRCIVEKYDGDIETEDADHLFQVKVLLYVKQRISP